MDHDSGVTYTRIQPFTANHPAYHDNTCGDVACKRTAAVTYPLQCDGDDERQASRDRRQSR